MEHGKLKRKWQKPHQGALQHGTHLKVDSFKHRASSNIPPQGVHSICQPGDAEKTTVRSCYVG
jgi:hypothetical protein